MPNLYSNFSMKSYGWLIVFLATFLYALLSSVMSIFVYSIGSIKEKYKKIINYLLYSLMALVVLGLFYNVVKIGEPLKAAISFLNMDFFNSSIYL